MKTKNKSIAIDIGGSRIKIATVGEGKIERIRTIPAHSEGKLADRLNDIAAATVEIAGELSQYDGVGVSLPCLVDPVSKRATEIYSKFEDAPSLDLATWAKDTFDLPFVIGQDSKLALLGEAHYGCAKEYDDVVMVIMGTGVGVAVMLDGELLQGRHFSSGALASHVVVERNGRKCTCKGRGCLEAYTATWALPQMLREHKDYPESLLANRKTQDYKALSEAVRAGDRIARDVLDNVISAMRAGLISFIHAYSPQAIVLSGGPLHMGEMFTKPLFAGINDIVWGKDDVDFLLAQDPDASVALGLHYLTMKETVRRNG